MPFSTCVAASDSDWSDWLTDHDYLTPLFEGSLTYKDASAPPNYFTRIPIWMIQNEALDSFAGTFFASAVLNDYITGADLTYFNTLVAP